jgi:DNA processing protein
MDVRALVALSLLPHCRRHVALAAAEADRVDGRLEVALAALEYSAPAAALLARADEAQAAALASGLSLSVWDEPSYPPALRQIVDPPLVLWRRGTLPPPDHLAIAIVGSRTASPGAAEIARRMARDLAIRGVVVVSGLARGCDGEAHRGTLAAGGVTVAVQGSGVDVPYPREHRALADDIARTGAVISEFPPGTPPRAHHFPLRNRIIAGMCRGVVVVEAGEKSGSLITAASALECGREVMVVPGGVLSGRNRGGHALIRDGAALVESAEDVLAVLGLATSAGTSPGRPSKPAGDPILSALDVDDGLDLDELTASLGVDASSLLARLTALELAGEVVRKPGGRFVRSSGKVIT